MSITPNQIDLVKLSLPKLLVKTGFITFTQISTKINQNLEEITGNALLIADPILIRFVSKIRTIINDLLLFYRIYPVMQNTMLFSLNVILFQTNLLLACVLELRSHLPLNITESDRANINYLIHLFITRIGTNILTNISRTYIIFVHTTSIKKITICVTNDCPRIRKNLLDKILILNKYLLTTNSSWIMNAISLLIVELEKIVGYLNLGCNAIIGRLLEVLEALVGALVVVLNHIPNIMPEFMVSAPETSIRSTEQLSNAIFGLQTLIIILFKCGC